VNGRQSRRFVEDLLRGKRPRRFQADETDAAELRTAIGLRAARPGSGAPREEFVTDLHKRLADELSETRNGRSAAANTSAVKSSASGRLPTFANISRYSRSTLSRYTASQSR